MLQSSQALLSEVIYKCINQEQTIESYRMNLSEQYDFCPQNFFYLVTSDSSISSRDLKLFFGKHKIGFKESDIFMTIKQYSCLQDGRISLEDFYQIILPSTNSSLRDRAINRPFIKAYSENTFNIFLKVFQEEINAQSELEDLKSSLHQQKDFTVYSAFETLAKGSQVIEERDLTEFLKLHRKNVGNDEIDAFFRRVDLENDHVISYNEFLEFIIPFKIPDKNPSVQVHTVKPEIEENKESELPKSSRDDAINENHDKKHGLGERLLEILLAARYEELKKQELAMITNFSISSGIKLIDLNNVGTISVENISLYLSLSINEVQCLFNQTSSLSQEDFQKLITPYNTIYQHLQSEPTSLSTISSRFLKSALLSIISTEKHLKNLWDYKKSALAISRNESSVELSQEHIQKFLTDIGIQLQKDDESLLLWRLGLNN